MTTSRIQQLYDQTMAALLEVESMKPTYDISGQNIEWTERRKQLMDQAEWCLKNGAVEADDGNMGPVFEVSRGCT